MSKKEKKGKVPEPQPWERAVDIAIGLLPRDPKDREEKIWGAKNDYNARGKYTYVRRVWRVGGDSWEWVSLPVGRGRWACHEITYGFVERGDVIAEYMYRLDGPRKSYRAPNAWYLVNPFEENGEHHWAWSLQATRRRGSTMWDLHIMTYQAVFLTVPDPYWE
jgi:hypothetical protein